MRRIKTAILNKIYLRRLSDAVDEANTRYKTISFSVEWEEDRHGKHLTVVKRWNRGKNITKELRFRCAGYLGAMECLKNE